MKLNILACLIVLLGLVSNANAQQYTGCTTSGTESYTGTASNYGHENAIGYLPNGIYMVFAPSEDDRDDPVLPTIEASSWSSYYLSYSTNVTNTLSIAASGSGGTENDWNTYGGEASAGFNGAFRLYFSGMANAKIKFNYSCAAGGNGSGCLYGWGYADQTKTASCGNAIYNPNTDSIWQNWDYIADWTYTNSFYNGTSIDNAVGSVQLDSNGVGYCDVNFVLNCWAKGGTNFGNGMRNQGFGFAASSASVSVCNVTYDIN